jgi:hypothetical protein
MRDETISFYVVLHAKVVATLTPKRKSVSGKLSDSNRKSGLRLLALSPCSGATSRHRVGQNLDPTRPMGPIQPVSQPNN